MNSTRNVRLDFHGVIFAYRFVQVAAMMAHTALTAVIASAGLPEISKRCVDLAYRFWCLDMFRICSTEGEYSIIDIKKQKIINILY